MRTLLCIAACLWVGVMGTCARGSDGPAAARSVDPGPALRAGVAALGGHQVRACP